MGGTGPSGEGKRVFDIEDIFQPVPHDFRFHWTTTFWVFVGMWTALFSIAGGYTIGLRTSTTIAIVACFAGYMFDSIIAILVGEVGRKEGLATYPLSRRPMGRVGQKMFGALVFFLATVAYGLQADIVGRTTTTTLLGIPLESPMFEPYRMVVSTIYGIVFLSSAYLGIKVMGWLSWATMPAFFTISCAAVWLALRDYPGGFAAVLAREVPGGLGFFDAMLMAAGMWAGFTACISDVTRFLRSRRDAVLSLPLAYFVGAIPPVMGALLAATIQVPYEEIFVKFGLGFAILGLFAWIGAAWTTDDNNAYTAGLALGTTVHPLVKLKRRRAVLICGILGIVFAAIGAGGIEWILFMIGILAHFLVPFGGVEIAHFWVVERMKTKIETRGFAGITAWLATGILSWQGLLPLGVIGGLAVSIALYLALYYGVEKPLLLAK
ncbi:MAG: cytosine permease [Desulfurococcaceae archaeon]